MSFERARLRKRERDKRGKRAKETEREIDRQTEIVCVFDSEYK